MRAQEVDDLENGGQGSGQLPFTRTLTTTSDVVMDIVLIALYIGEVAIVDSYMRAVPDHGE